MSDEVPQLETLVTEGTARLLERATDARSLSPAALEPRVRAAVDKYLLRDDPGASAQSIRQFVDALHADDLCLIIACERGDQSAWTDLVARFESTVRSAARSAGGSEDTAEDLAQSIWAELHGLRVRADGMPAGKLAYYSGRGSLGGWLRAVVAQLAVDQHRKQSRLVQTGTDTEFDRLARDSNQAEEQSSVNSTQCDPESTLTERRTSRDVEAALAKAIASLAAEERLLVKLYYFDGLRLREAGALLGVHEATASRRLAKAQAEVRQKVESLLMKEHGWTRAETLRGLSEAASRLETDVELMLTGEAGTQKGQGQRA